MFMPASRTRTSSAAQLRLRGRHRDRVDRRPHGAAREHADAVDVQVEPVPFDVVAGRAPEASSRKPTRPASTTVSCSALETRRRMSCKAGSPWVCGHHRATSANLELAARNAGVASQSPARQPASSCAAVASREPLSSTSHRRRRACRAAPVAARAPRASRPRRQARTEPQPLDLDVAAGARGAHRAPRADHGRSWRDAGAAAEQHRAEEAQVALVHQPRAPARARATAHAQQRRERAAADRKLVALAQPPGDIERVCGEHRVALEHAARR